MGLVPKKKFEDVLAEIEAQAYYKVKLPDRTARIIIESPTVASIDPELDDFEGEQRRRAVEEVKQAEIKKAAHETGAPRELLRALQDHPRTYSVDTSEMDAQRARAIQLGLDEATQEVDRAVAVHNGVLRVAEQARQSLAVAHRQNPIHDISHHFIGDDEDIEDVPVFQPNLHTPQVPTTITYRPSADELARMDREFQATQPGLLDMIGAAGGFLQGVGSVAQGVGTIAGAVAQPAARELMQASLAGGSAAMQVAAVGGPPLARGAGRLALGTLRGGLSVTSHTARGVTSALQGLAALGMPVQRRAERFHEGINVAEGFGRLMANQHIH